MKGKTQKRQKRKDTVKKGRRKERKKARTDLVTTEDRTKNIMNVRTKGRR